MRKSSLIRGCVLALSIPAFLPQVSGAAEVTRIATAFEPGNPFDLFFDIHFNRLQQRAKLVREAHQDGALVDVNELRFVDIQNTVDVKAHIGIWKDLELTVNVPYVLSWQRRYGFPAGTDASNSTASNNCIDARGELLDPSCPSTGLGAQALYDPNARVSRRGLGNLRFGFNYGIFNQAKDDTKPTWIIGFEYEAPTAARLEPAAPTSSDVPGEVGDKVHKYIFSTAFSRRLGAADPYLKLVYALPVRGPGWYSNCDNPDAATQGYPENCTLPVWGREAAGIEYPHIGTVLFGTELVAHEAPATGGKVSIDVRGLTRYVSQGRYANPLSDLFGKLMRTGEYLELGGMVGLYAKATEAAQLNLATGFSYQTEHWISGEKIGRDLNGNGTVDVLGDTTEFSPTFDSRVDMLSRRYRSVDNYVFSVDANLVISF